MCKLMNEMNDMYAVVIMIELNCLGCLIAGLNFWNYPNYRGNSAEISLKTYNLEFSSKLEFPCKLDEPRIRTGIRPL